MPTPAQPRPPSPLPRAVLSLLLSATAVFCALKATALLENASPQALAEAPPLPAPEPPPLPVTPAPPPPDPDILIDPGHGGADPGRIGKDGQHEKKWALEVATSLATQLRSAGWKVSLTRTDDSTLPLADRSLIANRSPRLLFVSIHFNAGDPAASGLETYFSWPRQPEIMARLHSAAGMSDGAILPPDGSEALAASIQNAACLATGSRNRGIRNRPELSVTSRSLCPSVLVECAFLTHPTDARNVASRPWRQRLVAGLASGISSWLQSAGYQPPARPDPPSNP
jgi:N-acetylmuramoyl-L-alanine amidase